MTINRKKNQIYLYLFICMFIFQGTAFSEQIINSNSISMHGKPDFENVSIKYPHVDINANKGGTFKYASLGTFNSTNPFIVKGRSAFGIKDFVFESLLSRNYSEPFSLYGLIAEKITYPEDRKWIEFHINKNAKFSDGVDLKASDVFFSFNQLKDNGRPNYRNYYSRISDVIITSNKSIKFILNDDEDDRELIMILGLMPILPEHHYKDGKFQEADLTIPIGSGPYIIENLDQGKNITYKKNTNYWGDNLSLNKGVNNFDYITVDYYLDDNSRFEAFKAGQFDFYQIWDPTRWNNLKSEKNVLNGKIKLLEINRKTPAGMLGLALNTRKPELSDIRVRKALTLLFDFEWINQNLYHGLYKRTQGFYDNSYLSSINNEITENEKNLLGSNELTVYEDEMSQFKKLENNNSRTELNNILNLLKESGYELNDSRLVNISTNKQLSLEFLISDKRQEKYALNFKETLKKVGIEMNIKMVDSTQYQQRKQNFEFDMIEHFWYASLSPGNEQNFYWSSKSADEIGSRNYPGIKSAKIDELIDTLVQSTEKNEFMYSVRALDRMLISGFYVIPLFHWPHQWVAISDKVGLPAQQSLDGYKTNTWYIN